NADGSVGVAPATSGPVDAYGLRSYRRSDARRARETRWPCFPLRRVRHCSVRVNHRLQRRVMQTTAMPRKASSTLALPTTNLYLGRCDARTRAMHGSIRHGVPIDLFVLLGTTSDGHRPLRLNR